MKFEDLIKICKFHKSDLHMEKYYFKYTIGNSMTIRVDIDGDYTFTIDGTHNSNNTYTKYDELTLESLVGLCKEYCAKEFREYNIDKILIID